jgi:hypothetical protein
MPKEDLPFQNEAYEMAFRGATSTPVEAADNEYTTLEDIIASCIERGRVLIASHATEELALALLMIRTIDDVDATSEIVGERAARRIHGPSSGASDASPEELLAPLEFACLVQASINAKTFTSAGLGNVGMKRDIESAISGWLSATERRSRWDSSPALREGVCFALYLSSKDDDSGLAHVKALLGDLSRADMRRMEALRATISDNDTDSELLVAMARRFAASLRIGK